MDLAMVKRVIERNLPFRIKTAGGDVYEVRHQDFVAFSSKRTTMIVNFTKDGEESIAYVPLLTITSIESVAPDPAG